MTEPSPTRIALPFTVRWPIIGMVHLKPLPGSPGWGGSIDQVLDRAQADAGALEEGGVDGVLVENFGDRPFLPGSVPPETVAALTRAVAAIRDRSTLPVGVNVLRNDARSALGIATATGAAFIRANVHAGSMFTDQGLLEGKAHETLRVRDALGAHVAILADVLVKHAVPPAGVTLEDAARELWDRAGADSLLVTGVATGSAPEPDRIRRVARAVPEAPVWVASGLAPGSVEALLRPAAGAIVGSAFQGGAVAGAGVEPERVARLMERVRMLRKAEGAE